LPQGSSSLQVTSLDKKKTASAVFLKEAQCWVQ